VAEVSQVRRRVLVHIASNPGYDMDCGHALGVSRFFIFHGNFKLILVNLRALFHSFRMRFYRLLIFDLERWTESFDSGTERGQGCCIQILA